MIEEKGRLKKSVIVIAAAAILCLTGSWSSAAGKPEVTKVDIGTASDPNLGGEIVIAKARGYFKDVGLNARVKFFPSGGDMSAAVAGGNIFMGSAGSTPSTTLRAAPFPIKIVAQQSDISGAQQIIVQKGINTLEDLYGKRIGVLKGTDSEMCVDSMIRDYRLDADKIIIVSMGPTEMLTSFGQRDIDAISVWEPHATRARNQFGGRVLISGSYNYLGDVPIPNRIFGDHALFYIAEKFIKKNPNTVSAVLEALARAVEFIEKDRENAVRILAQEFKMTEKEMSFIASPLVNYYMMRLDQTLVDDLTYLANFLFRVGKINTMVKPEQWIDPEPLRKVRPQWVTLQ